MTAAWKSLGTKIDSVEDEGTRVLLVEGNAGTIQAKNPEIHVANSGTSIRFLTAALCACHAATPTPITLDGIERMRKRPIGDLITALRLLGGEVDSINQDEPNCPPVQLKANGIEGGTAKIKGNISSQFLSGLMMAAALAKEPTEISIVGDLVSVPYVRMTSAVMRSFGCQVVGEAPQPLHVANGGYIGCEYDIEPDASAASYYWASAAITGGQATVTGLSRKSLQGDVGFCTVLEKMGCKVDWGSDSITVRGTSALHGIDINMEEISDTAQTLAAVALFAEGPTRVRGVAHNRVKETDRIGDLAIELRKTGAVVTEFYDGLEIVPPKELKPAQFATYNDHRMAMSLALVGLRQSGVRIENPGCTAKTYPNFWEDLNRFSGCRIDWGV